jgi:hypothetical protein
MAARSRGRTHASAGVLLLALVILEPGATRAEASVPANEAEHWRPTIELRLTAPFLRPVDAPSLGGLLALPVSGHLWVGGGFELLQDYDVELWTGPTYKHWPVVMSGLRAGAWYRGGVPQWGRTYAVGGIVTVANPVFSPASSPDELGRGSFAVDVGPDLSFGHVWKGFRFEVFATPAWSWGRFTSTTMPLNVEHMSKFTYRIGVGFAILIGA